MKVIKIFNKLELAYKNPKSLMYKKMIKVLNLINNGKYLLDLGCGTGEFLFRLRNKFDYLIGLDKDISFAKRKLHKIRNIKLIEADIIHFDGFNKEQFDYCLALDFLEHFKHPEIIVKKIYKWLKPNGKLIITTPNFYNFFRLDEEHKTAHSIYGWSKILKKNKLKIIYRGCVEFPLIHFKFLSDKFYFLGKCLIIISKK